MATFVHLAPEDSLPRLRRGGIRPSRVGPIGAELKGVFAMPVTRDFSVTHQWLRELRRFHAGRICGVYFRIEDNEPVLMGHYGKPQVRVLASEAVAHAASNEAQGFQVIVPRAISVREILRTKLLPQLVGWRYYPDAKGRKPCGCPACLRGEYGARKLRDASENE